MRGLVCATLVLTSSMMAMMGMVEGVNNGVGRTPAMGYNTWNDFRCAGINADNIMKVADSMVAYGLVDIGYEYLNIDDCWSVGRDPTTHKLLPNATAFPDGMAAVADYVHSKGLKFGIYTDRGTTTCQGRPGSYGYEALDAQTFADWGVDYVKEDSCAATQNHTQAFAEYGKMRDGLNATGREIYFSLCGWNSWYAPVGQSLGNSWRIAGDCNLWPSVWNAIHVNEVLAKYAGPGGWNDPDMLVGSSPDAAVHNTPAQARTQFSLWSIMAGPLLIGSNILDLPLWDLETYSNKEVIAIDQDPLGVQGFPVWSNCPTSTVEEAVSRMMSASTTVPSCQQIWAKKLADGSYGVAFVNYDVSGAEVTCDESCMSAMGLTTVTVRDLWAHFDVPGTFTTFSANLEGNGASLTFKFTPVSSA